MIPTHCIITTPATCELCGQWMPGHSSDCPRRGVHPSQWNLSIINENEPINFPENSEYIGIIESEIINNPITIISPSHPWRFM